MYNYGLLRGNARAMEIGDALFGNCLLAGRTGSYPAAEDKPGHRFQGSPMVTVGAFVDVLKVVAVLEAAGRSDLDDLKRKLIDGGRELIDYILSNHYDPETHDFWEENGPDGEPWINEAGQQICDPGHTAEACAFFAELCDLAPDDETDTEWHWPKQAIVDAALEMNDLVTRHGFSPAGVMFKNVDLRTKQGVADTSGGGVTIGKPTAPWWNVREHCAACLKLYQLTRDDRCLAGYVRSQNASYRYYPNARIGGLMVQTIDPFTLEPMDIHPATGNIDPMHSARAREREIEALELIRE
jgi:mannose/cellobiose epimerase-like protein (N-acyl-D-glucosamine 2-epimerase family)